MPNLSNLKKKNYKNTRKCKRNKVFFNKQTYIMQPDAT